MKTRGKFPFGPEGIVLALLVLAWVFLGFVLVRHGSAERGVLSARNWMEPGAVRAVPAPDLQEVGADCSALQTPVQSGDKGMGLFSSELRVVAIGSAYPIPYGAEVCPFSGIPQPAMDQLDRDGDGMTDDWEVKYGFDKYNVADAAKDLDGDGFSNLEEFESATDPTRPDSHPPYVTKLRFLGMKEIPFPLVFQGISELPDGRKVFQVNTAADGKSHFAGIGEYLEGVEFKEFIPQDAAGSDRLVVVKNNTEIVLPRGTEVPDPKSQGELINILDRSSEIATMGELLSLRDDEYAVLGVYPDRVAVRSQTTGEVFEILGFAGGERDEFSGGFKQ